MPDSPRAGDNEGFAHWSGYAPGKENPDPTTRLESPLVALNAEELHAEARRFRRGAIRAEEVGDVAKAERLRRVADEFEQRAAASG